MHPCLNRSLALTGLEATPGKPWSAGPRSAIEWAASLGYRFVQLDATTPGMRPRELGRSARRDVASLLRRFGLGLSGLDLWIPSEHFALPEHVDRAASATLRALELASELVKLQGGGSAVVSVELSTDVARSVVDSLALAAERLGARLADHAWPVHAGVGASAGSPISVGLDPVRILGAGADPATEVVRLPAPPGSARLSDAGVGTRVVPGGSGGRLNVQEYEVALSTAAYAGQLIVDLRGLRDQAEAAATLLGG